MQNPQLDDGPKADECNDMDLQEKENIIVEKKQQDREGRDHKKVDFAWDRPLFCHTDAHSTLKKIKRPLIRFFKFSAIEELIQAGKKDLAGIMLVVLASQNQPKRHDAKQNPRFWGLWEKLDRTAHDLYSIIEAASIRGKDLGSSTLECPAYYSQSRILGSSSDSEIVNLENEINEIISRTPVLQKCTPPPRDNRVLIEAANTIAGTKFYDSLKMNHNNTKVGNGTEGSALLYAILTPKKRIQEELETNLVITPVRRSQRLLACSTRKSDAFKDLSEIPDLEQMGYLPNPAINPKNNFDLKK